MSFKNIAAIFFYYLLAIIIAVFSSEMLSLVFSMLLITVQGPTLLTQIIRISTYYAVLSMSSLFLFKMLGRRQHKIKIIDLLLFISMIIVIQMVIVFYAEWRVVWFITTGTFNLTTLLYSKGLSIESIRDIPRLYYLMPLLIEDLCVTVFSIMGYSWGHSKKYAK